MRYFLKAGGAVAVVGLMMAGCSSIGPGSSPAPAPIGASTAPVGGECNAQ
ncbi:MAG: proteinase inhibitor I78, partial [Acidovorax sp.]